MSRFDSAYFERFYESRASRVHGRQKVAQHARALTSVIAWQGGELRSVLEVGAGTGLLRDWFRRHKPEVKYVSTDVSPFACERYGHLERDVSRWRAREKFDLVVCQGVLPYLDDASCAQAIDNLGHMARGFLYVEAVTAHDLAEVCDRTKTDLAQHARPASFYRPKLEAHFVPLGLGLFYSKRGPLAFYELETG